MRATKVNRESKNKILVDSTGLQDMLSTGLQSAVAIGTKAGARTQIGRRVFWNVEKVRQYLNAISE